MKILVTGNMGYVGPAVVRRLRRAFPAATVLGFDIGYFAHCLTNPERLPESRVHAQYFGDIRSIPHELLAGVDAIVHLAAISNDPMGNRCEQVTLEINHRASVRLAGAARAAGVKSFVFASSCSVYGSAEDGARRESSALNPLTAYARSKVLTEQDLAALACPGFQVSCLRFATACGMSDRLRLDLVLNDFVAAACSAGHIIILSDGSPWRPLIDVVDMARAIEWAVGRKFSAGGPFLVMNTGSDEWNFQVRELAQAVAEILPETRVSINAGAQPDKRSYRVSFELFRTLAPGHQPQMTLRESIERLVGGLAAMEFRDRNFRDSRLVRLKVLTDLRERGLLDELLQWVEPAVSAEREVGAFAGVSAL